LVIERGNGKETEGKIDWESYCLNWLVQAVGERKGRRRKSRCGGRPAKQRRRINEGGGRKLTGGTQPSARAKKRKKRVVAWTGAGKGWWAAGPLGPKGKKGLFFFFFFSFSNSF
jgi:hypothetical protein